MTRPLIFGLTIIAIAVVSPVQAQPSPRLSICHAPPNEQRFEWRRSTLKHIFRILQVDGHPATIRVRRGVCNSSMPDTSCSGIPNEMFCRQISFNRMHVAAAHYAIAYVQSGARSYEAFRLANPKFVTQAFKLADGALDLQVLERSIGTLSEQAEARAAGSAASVQPTRIERIMDRIVSFNVAALVGHETHHMGSEKCPIGEPSPSEKKHFFSHIVDQQTTGGLFKTAYPDPNEIKADRCAMRQITRLHSDLIGDPTDANSDEMFARRATADMVAFQTLFGSRRFDQLPAGVYVTPDLDQYLYPAFRIVLLSGAIADPHVRPGICGEAAELFAHAVQTGFDKAPGDGLVSDNILAMLPAGVEKSWNGAPWTAQSVSCFNK